MSVRDGDLLLLETQRCGKTRSEAGGLTTEEVASILGKHPNRIRELVNKNKLDALVVIDRMFIPQGSVNAYLARKAAKK